MRLLVFGLVCLWLSGGAWAELSAAESAFYNGEYATAAELAGEDKSADGEALRARALLAAIVVAGHEPDADAIALARAAAERCLAHDPGHSEGRLQLAIALSFEARPLPLRVLARSDHGRRARALAQDVLSEEPENIYALGFLSVWHIEAVRRAGPFAAGFVGARVSTGHTFYQQAAELAPDDASLHWQYARSLAALNAKRYRQDIDAALAAAVAARADTALEEVMQSRARVLQTALGIMPAEEAEDLAKRML